MSANVIIFGAGASADAGVPLLRNLIDQIWQAAQRGEIGGKRLSEEDVHIFQSAMAICEHLDKFHGRANFDDRNVEDVLSILSFEAMATGRPGRDSFECIQRAVSRIVELNCRVQQSRELTRPTYEGEKVYLNFWRCLLRLAVRDSFPALITFNYDLVLERSLLGAIVRHRISGRDLFPAIGVVLNCGHPDIPPAGFGIKDLDDDVRSTILIPHADSLPEEYWSVMLLKLHGSLSFRNDKPLTTFGSDPAAVASPQDQPLILPPIFSKSERMKITPIWKSAIQELRSAKHVVFVGYSMPRTDVYMQYFLKAALGPNFSLNRITVFDPVLFVPSEEGAGVRARYEECFSEQIRARIEFNPRFEDSWRRLFEPGTFRHFVHLMEHDWNCILF